MQITDYPALFQGSDAASLTGQRWYKRLTTIELSFVVFGALIASALSFSPDRERAVALAAAIAFGGALLVRIVTRIRGDDHVWFDGRAVAETVKSQTWTYMMRVPPFDDDANADRTFIDRLTAAARARPGIAQVPASVEHPSQITPTMRERRRRPLDARLRAYMTDRLEASIRWYGRSAARHGRKARIWSLAALLAEAAAVVAALVAVFSESVGQLGLLGFFGAIAAAFTAWNQLGRHAEVARAYGLAHQELLNIAALGEGVATEPGLAALVQDGEAAISREHSMWVARRADPLAIDAPAAGA